MSNMIFYYVLLSSPYEIQSTDILDELITLIYEGKADFISEGQRIGLKLPNDYFDSLRRTISRNEDNVPLYDIISNHIFPIHWENVYPRIFFDNYRFVNKNFYEDLKNLDVPTNIDKENLRILSYYDMNVLYETYTKIFYKSFVMNSYITNCKRPSFNSGMEHISPYYNINELNYLAFDWNLTNKIIQDPDQINDLCIKISQYDIPAQTLLDHQMYIYNSKAIGLVKHYSLFGSYYMNVYLRKTGCCLQDTKSYEDVIRNLYLENQVKIMIRLIKNAPSFIKSHTVYRFVERDEYLRHLKVGDIYQDASFMSTTRNPFYYKENYAFGYILIKIQLPSDVKGVGLSIESYSNFPSEEEIILPPTSKYRLENVIDTSTNSDFHDAFKLKVQKKYVFTWVGNNYINKADSDITINMPDAYIPEPKIVNLRDLLNDENIKLLTISDRLKYFRDSYTNINNQFEAIIGNIKYTFNFESYDSTSVYKPFFYYEVKDGIMVTTSNPKYGNINIMMEIGPEIHINYYFRFSVTDPSIVVDLNRPEWIEWFSLFAYIIGSRTVIIHSNYTLQYNKNDTPEQKIMKTRYTFSQNIYLYMKHKKKMFEFMEIVPHFDYFMLDYLLGIQVNDVIKSADKNELFRIAQSSEINNMYDFYIYIVENYPKLIKIVEEKMETIYEPERNPFLNMQYSLDAWLYLYNRDLIKHIPSEKEFVVKKGSFKKLVGDKKIPKFKNRLREYFGSRKN
ncbi:hypothetical protein QJ857_gp0454 [Tupanvirus soda lake]|uniref:ADP ribosyltransferase domain-containing protein n=2 Tax=Tupanvirus TaxID=2094720 RepID=A0A6N1NW00_9VIRU|nr:hypothetical protein QJ857_gp0454 [Tupanvirus soda lake]QKU35586.1 hypothetical protein [Tupanvirus soda lake]